MGRGVWQGGSTVVRCSQAVLSLIACAHDSLASKWLLGQSRVVDGQDWHNNDGAESETEGEI